MKLGQIAVKLRLAATRFGNYVAGSAEMALALRNTLNQEAAFIIPLLEQCSPNQNDNSISQIITERFGVVVALKNDSSKTDKLGITAYDLLDTVRSQIFSGILNYRITATDESNIYYSGARLLDINPAWLWYQFEFEYKKRIDDDDGVAQGDVDDLESIYTQPEQWPSVNLPYDGNLPVNAFTVDMSDLITLADDPYVGAFDRAFSEGFDDYPKDDRWR